MLKHDECAALVVKLGAKEMTEAIGRALPIIEMVTDELAFIFSHQLLHIKLCN